MENVASSVSRPSEGQRTVRRGQAERFIQKCRRALRRAPAVKPSVVAGSPSATSIVTDRSGPDAVNLEVQGSGRIGAHPAEQAGTGEIGRQRGDCLLHRHTGAQRRRDHPDRRSPHHRPPASASRAPPAGCPTCRPGPGKKPHRVPRLAHRKTTSDQQKNPEPAPLPLLFQPRASAPSPAAAPGVDTSPSSVRAVFPEAVSVAISKPITPPCAVKTSCPLAFTSMEMRC